MVQEIKERLEFLQEMEELGEAKPYQIVIEQEIAARMKQMEKIDQQKLLQLGISLDSLHVSSNKKNTKQAKPTLSLKNNIFPNN